ncbi:MAG: hypothetical protein H5T86_10970 [Armatimonadetes bacterium]|nr:hypothetical protein [Armatimonadota bacterium]
MWRRCAQLYSRPRPKEWDLSIFAVGLRNPDTADTDERSWAEKARQALFSLGQEAQTEFGDDFNPDEPVTELFLQYPPAYIRVLDADLPDGSRRNLALAEDELLIGAYELALSDFNRVYTLRTPNSWSDMAMTKAGECAWLIGNKAAAISLWERCNTTYTGQTWGDLAGRMLYAASHDIETPSDKHLPPDAVSILEEEIVAPEAEGFVPRGLSLAAAEFQSRSLSGALTECLRIIHNFYSSSTARSETQRKLLREWQATAAYWAGIVCCWLAKPDAAVVQWQRAAKAYPGTPAAAKAQHALRTLQSYHGLSPAQRAAVQAALGAHGVAFASDPDRALAWQCLNDGVPDVSPVAIQRHVALELLCCGCWKEALAAFLGVLTSAVADGPNEGRWHDEALYFAGVCLERLGKTQRAQARWQELLRCFPRSEFAARAQKKLTGAAGARQEVGSRG